MTDMTPYINLWLYFFGISAIISLIAHSKVRTKTSKIVLYILGSIFIISFIIVISFMLIYIIQLLRTPPEL